MHHDSVLPTLSIFFIICARDLFLLNVIDTAIKPSVSSPRNKHFVMKMCTFLSLSLLFFFFFWPRWVFVAAHGLSLVVVSGGYSSLQCAGFSLQWLLLLWSAGFSSCGMWAQ